jgi:hypothetical protein
VFDYYWPVFWQLIQTPFGHPELVWGIVPLYFGWALNELTSAKASFRTAIQTGFSFIWAGSHWLYQYFKVRPPQTPPLGLDVLFAVNIVVTMCVLLVGLVALVSGLRRRYPKYCSFLGHTRFSNYFMIAIFPIQSGYLSWSWPRITAIAIFAVPLWLLLHFGFMPLRRKG